MSTHAPLEVKPAVAPPVQTPAPAPFGTLQRKCACGGSGSSGGDCEGCKKKKLQRRAAGSGPETAPPIVHDVLRSPGQPLDSATRAFFEPRFGHDFGNVRIHADARADQSARAVNALAYTVGPQIVFGSGLYQPGASSGQRLLAHELTHVVQQHDNGPVSPGALGVGPADDAAEQQADRAEQALASSSLVVPSASPSLQRKVNPASVSCRTTGLTNPDLTGDEAVAALQEASTDAVELALRAQLALDAHLLLARGGQPVDADFDTILREELGLTLTNPAHFSLVAQQVERFRRVHDLLNGGTLHYVCRGGTVGLVGCTAGTCGQNFAFSCPANSTTVLCQAFWDNPDQRSATILHEPFHILFEMARHQANALRRADASCFESFALRVAGRGAFASCVDHTNG